MSMFLLFTLVLLAETPFERGFSEREVFHLSMDRLGRQDLQGRTENVQLAPMCYWQVSGRECVGILVSNRDRNGAAVVFVDSTGRVLAESESITEPVCPLLAPGLFRSRHDSLFLCFNTDSAYLVRGGHITKVEDPWSLSGLGRSCPKIGMSYVFDINGRKRPLFFLGDSSIFMLQRDSVLLVEREPNESKEIGRLDWPELDYLVSQSPDPLPWASEKGVALYSNPFSIYMYRFGKSQAVCVLDLWPVIDQRLHGKGGISKIRAEAEQMGISLFYRKGALFSVIFALDGIHVIQLNMNDMLMQQR